MDTTAPKTFLTFAYGSNMLTRRIRERCRSATALGMAELPGHELRWHKRSRDGSGKCDVAAVDAPNATVFGVLYEIAVDEKHPLDQAEGLGSGYDAKAVTVICKGQPYDASVYYATAIDTSLKPYTWYKALVVTGAREHGLPASYLERLESTEAREDSDCYREAMNLQIADAE